MLNTVSCQKPICNPLPYPTYSPPKKPNSKYFSCLPKPEFISPGKLYEFHPIKFQT